MSFKFPDYGSNHRKYVGGSDTEMWYHIGKIQYHFLVSSGLKPCHIFLDLACGSLRLGQWLIPMLNAGNYYGLDARKDMVQKGLDNEILYDVVKVKNPHFSFNHSFDFSFIDTFDYAMAQSLFTHLSMECIESCFKNISEVMNKNSKFYFTFKKGNSDTNPSVVMHPGKLWKYQIEELEEAAGKFNLKLNHIGNWKHPRNQNLVLCQKK